MRTIIPITSEIETACVSIERSIGRFLNARATFPTLGSYESQIEALNLFNLTIRNTEGVMSLARTDLVLLPAAAAVARAALESGVKAMWMVDVDDPFDGETRWLAHLKEEERFHERMAARSKDTGGWSNGERNIAAQIRSFREAVGAKLPHGKRELARNPSMDDMLKAVGSEHLYLAYIQFSQFVHGGHAGSALYRRHLGTERCWVSSSTLVTGCCHCLWCG